MADDHGAGRALANELRRLIPRLYRRYRYHDDGAITPSQLSTMCHLEEHGPMRLGQLAKAEELTPATVSRLIDRLAGDGFVHRRPDEDDARATRIGLTPAGQRILDSQRQQRTAMMVAAIERLSTPELEALVTALPVLAKLLDAPVSPDGGERLHQLISGSAASTT